MSYVNNSYDINVIDNWYSSFDDYRGKAEISKNGEKLGTVIVNFSEDEIRKTIGKVEDDFSKAEIQSAIASLIATNVEKYCSLPKISEVSPLLRTIYDDLLNSENSMIYISNDDWRIDYSDDFSKDDLRNLKKEIQILHLESIVEFNYEDYLIIGYGNLETSFIDDRGVVPEKQITTMDFLKEQKEMILHNISCYSDGRFISVAKKGYEKEFNRENQKLQIVKELVEHEEKLKTQDTDLDYYTFVIGYDFLHDFFINSEDPECDVVFEKCSELAKEFMKSDEYTNMFHSGYENLQRWLDKNKYRIKNDYMSDKQPEKVKKHIDRER